MNCTKTDCPAAQQCPKVQYRGSICAALRDEHGLGDPLTNADKIRQMTDEELADFWPIGICPQNRSCFRQGIRYTECPGEEIPSCTDCWLDWLKQEVKDNA